MKRSRLDGTRTSAVMVRVEPGRVSSNASVNPRLGMNGNGWAGSTAIGVSTGKISSRNSRCRYFTWSGDRSLASWITTSFSNSSSRSVCQWSCCSSCRCWASVAISSSCSDGVRPSALCLVMPARSWPLRPATRTMKNSSRLLAEIETNRMRSSSGWLGLPASSSTRMLNCSQLTSRLTKRAGLCRSASMSGVAVSSARISPISFIVVAFQVQFELRHARVRPAPPRRCGG